MKFLVDSINEIKNNLLKTNNIKELRNLNLQTQVIAFIKEQTVIIK